MPPRHRVATGIYRDKHGLAGIVTVGERRKERRFPPDTELETIKSWMEKTRVWLRSKRPVGRKGTLAGDASRYLAQVRHLTSYKARSVEVRAWVKAFPTQLRDRITAADVRRVRASWLANGTSPKTVNNRVQTLRHLYRTLDGPDADTPCDSVPPLAVPKVPPVYITAADVLKVDAELQRREAVGDLHDAKTRARFRVLASTGKRPSEVMRAQPQDVDLERRVWIVRDGKGGYSPGLYLNADMLSAWHLFVAAEAWGPYHTNSFARTLRASGWPANVKPYNLRHTTWIEASERGADLSDVQAGAGHKSLATTRRHYVPVRESRMQKLSELIDGRFNWPDGLPRELPSMPATPRENMRHSARPPRGNSPLTIVRNT